MPTLRADSREFPISTDAWEAWKEAAEPFELPDDVLRRVFGVPSEASSAKTAGVAGRRSSRRAPTSGRRRSRVASDLLLPEDEYEVPILRALSDTGGRRPTREVVDAVGRELTDRLTELDREPVHVGGPPRWQNRVQFARLRLVKTGLMKAGSPRGVWEIAPAGEERLREASG